MARRDALDELKLVRYCCRRMVLTHVDLIEKAEISPENIEEFVAAGSLDGVGGGN